MTFFFKVLTCFLALMLVYIILGVQSSKGESIQIGDTVTIGVNAEVKTPETIETALENCQVVYTKDGIEITC